jgi:hypothetical protein
VVAHSEVIVESLIPAGTLYQKLCHATEGYASAVPMIHQAAAVRAAIDALDAGVREERNPNS